MAQLTMYLMLGFPGAGKTTAAKIIAGLTGAVHLASYHIRLEMFPKPKFSEQEHQMLYDEIDRRTKELLMAGKSVVYDANLNRYVHRQEKYEICRRVGVSSVLVWIKIDKELARQRATAAERKHLVPPGEDSQAMFERIVGILEEPRPGEPTV